MKLSKTQQEKFTISGTWSNITKHEKSQENVISNKINKSLQNDTVMTQILYLEHTDIKTVVILFCFQEHRGKKSKHIN